MFTGIIEAALPLKELRATAGGGVRIAIGLPYGWKGSIKLGDSIAINGVCLTVSAFEGESMCFDAIPETMRLTNLGDLRGGDTINLERALAAGARMDGHIVQGHVDATGAIAAIESHGDEWRVNINAGKEFCDQCVYKGSVCIDGISLTIAELTDTHLGVAIIPHTWKVTNLGKRKVGQRVNLEADVIGKYVKRQLAQILDGMAQGGGVTLESLRANGFLAG